MPGAPLTAGDRPPPIADASSGRDQRPGHTAATSQRKSRNRSSTMRKRALRRLARERRSAYDEAYQAIRPLTETRFHARDRAFTQLRHRYPDRYLELYAEERAGVTTSVPPGLRSKSWQRAIARLADLSGPAYQELSREMRARGMSSGRAYDMAMTRIRHASGELFAALLADELMMWLGEAGISIPCEDTAAGVAVPVRDQPNGTGQARHLAAGAPSRARTTP
jgi:hypothetical protein